MLDIGDSTGFGFRVQGLGFRVLGLGSLFHKKISVPCYRITVLDLGEC